MSAPFDRVTFDPFIFDVGAQWLKTSGTAFATPLPPPNPPSSGTWTEAARTTHIPPFTKWTK